MRQTPDGRLSQQINDALDGAAMGAEFVSRYSHRMWTKHDPFVSDGASSGSAVLLGMIIEVSFGVTLLIKFHCSGTYTESSRKAYWQNASDAQLHYVRKDIDINISIKLYLSC